MLYNASLIHPVWRSSGSRIYAQFQFKFIFCLCNYSNAGFCRMINVLPIIPEERSSGSRIYISNFEQPQSKVQKFNNGDWSLVRNIRDDYNQTITLLPVQSTRYVAIVRNGFLCIKEVQIYQRQRKCLMVSLTLKLKVEKLEYLTQELESRTRFGSCVTSLKISNQTPIFLHSVDSQIAVSKCIFKHLEFFPENIDGIIAVSFTTVKGGQEACIFLLYHTEFLSLYLE